MQAAKHPQQDENDDDHADHAAHAGQSVSTVCVVTTAASKEEEKYYDDQYQAHGFILTSTSSNIHRRIRKRLVGFKVPQR
jgi:hypothetical protein